MLVGEQPGDREDLIGHPFIGPAGALLDRALAEAGISRDDVYLTNVVKHFNWEARGKRRIHRKPNLGHIRACRPWLDAEIKLVDPEVLVLLGATAAQSLLGRDFRVTGHRGEFADSSLAPLVLATVHPSSILRARQRHSRRRARGIRSRFPCGRRRNAPVRSPRGIPRVGGRTAPGYQLRSPSGRYVHLKEVRHEDRKDRPRGGGRAGSSDRGGAG
jgi:uracil-DNA glycosylase family 4